MRRLTPSEVIVARLIAEGMDNAAAARSCGKTVKRVKTLLNGVYRKLEIPGARSTKRVRLGILLNCELFNIGLKEIQAA